MFHKNPLKERTVGRWGDILPALGIGQQYLRNKQGPCPACAGRDRYRYDNKGGHGTFYCNKCGPGWGVNLVMNVHRVNFKGAADLIEPLLPSTRVRIPKQKKEGYGVEIADTVWRLGAPLNGSDPASKYLSKRGLTAYSNPSLRYVASLEYLHEDKSRSFHPAMVARFLSPDKTLSTVHRTYLCPDGSKADVPTPRKMAPGQIPDGGSIRLAHAAETMGIAEGIETALSAMKLFDVPVWAATSANALAKWSPPEVAKCILIFADNDRSFTGHLHSANLAYKLTGLGYQVEIRMPEEAGTDWNDVLQSEAR
jgi:putative DNA primase/helicase